MPVPDRLARASRMRRAWLARLVLVLLAGLALWPALRVALPGSQPTPEELRRWVCSARAQPPP